MRIFSIAAGCALGLSTLLSHAAATDDDDAQKPVGLGHSRSPLNDDFKDYVHGLLEKWHVPGLAVAVVDGDDTWAEGYGIATYPSTPVEPSTLFYCASTTKAFVAGALSLMIDSGNYTTAAGAPEDPYHHTNHQQQHQQLGAYAPLPLDWSTPIAAILPADFVLEDPWATAHLTLQDALSHRTGLPRHDRALAHSYDGGATAATLADVVRSLRRLPLAAEPRQRFAYCNLMYAAVSHAVETLAGGRWLGDLLREWLWEPLGMRSTYFSLDDALAAPEHFATGYYWDGPAGGYVPVAHMPLEQVSGAGSVVSNVVDYAKWARSLLYEEGPLSAAGHRAIKAPRIVVAGDDDDDDGLDTPMAYASGWFTSSYGGHRFWTHSGGMHAYGAEVYLFPGEKFAVVTLGNTALTSNAVGETVAYRLIDEKLKTPGEKRQNWDQKWENITREALEAIENAVDTMYPDRPKPGLPHTLPLEDYAGRYFHPGYLNLTIEVVESKQAEGEGKTLYAERKNIVWEHTCEFEHISGEYWMVYMERSGHFTEFAPAQFRLGPSGKVTGLEISFMSEGILEANILFTKQE